MNDEKYISIWLNEELTQEDKKSLLPEDVYSRLQEIDESLSSFKAPEWNTEEQLMMLQTSLEKREARVVNMTPVYGLLAAAVITILIVFYFILRPSMTEINAMPGETITHYLPDSSLVILNAGTSISYNEDSWEEERNIELQGEAFFSVRKGALFSVSGNEWSVEVLGTQFNILSRSNLFNVKCYEGKVRVKYPGEERILTRGMGLIDNNGTFNSLSFSGDINQPAWISGTTEFNSQPLSYVLEEVERQFDIDIKTEGMETTTLFTGTIDRNNLNSALNTISLSTGCEIEFKDNTALFKCDNP